MNVYAVIILVTLLLDYTLNLLADLLNLGALRHDLPKEFVGVYDAEAYRKSQEYTRVQTRIAVRKGVTVVPTVAIQQNSQGPFVFLSTPGGIAALNAEVTRQAAMVAYIDDFRLMMLIALATLPVLLLLRWGRRPSTVAADD